MKGRIPAEVEAMLHSAGWFEGRSEFPLELPSDYTLFPSARIALEEFGGLDVGACGPGTNFARCDIQFDPNAAEGLASIVSVTDEGLRLYPLGEATHGHAYLLIDEKGAVYLYFNHLKKFGSSLDEALVSLLLGVNPKGD